MPDPRETHSSTSDQIACPRCAHPIRDLWDYDWDDREEIEVECSGCGGQVLIYRWVRVDYTAAARGKA